MKVLVVAVCAALFSVTLDALGLTWLGGRWWFVAPVLCCFALAIRLQSRHAASKPIRAVRDAR